MALQVVERPGDGPTERILILLPGFCDEPSVWVDQLDLIDPQGRWHVVVVRPRVQTSAGPAWYRVGADGLDQTAIGESVAAVAEFAATALAENSLTSDHLVVAGFSQGGATALATAVDPTAAVRPSAVAVVAGYLPDRDADLDTSLMARRPALFIHGRDDETIDLIRGRSAARALDRAGASVTWNEVAGGHQLGPDLLDPMRTWLDALRIGAIPSGPPA